MKEEQARLVVQDTPNQLVRTGYALELTEIEVSQVRHSQDAITPRAWMPILHPAKVTTTAFRVLHITLAESDTIKEFSFQFVF